MNVYASKENLANYIEEVNVWWTSPADCIIAIDINCSVIPVNAQG